MYRIPCQLEGEEQAALFRWAQFQSGKYPELDLMFHIPNGGKRGKAEAARFKAEGVKAGVPDIFFPKAKWIETKRPGGGFDNWCPYRGTNLKTCDNACGKPHKCE